MAVKTAEDAGTVTEKVIRTRTLPAGSAATDDDSAKPWRTMPWSDYLSSLSAQAWTDHVVYLYRYDDKGNAWGVAKFTSPLDEFKIQDQFGGGLFNVKVKKGPQLIINQDVPLEGAPKTPESAAAARPGTLNGDPLLMSITALIEELRAARGGTVQTDAIRSAMGLQAQVFGAGVDAVKSTLAHVAPPPATTNPMDDLMKQFITAAISKMMNPADPIVQFGAMVTAMKGLNLFGDSGGKTTMAMELVRQVPTIANSLLHGAEQWRLGMEAVARAEALRRGGGVPQPIPQAVIVQQPPAAPPPAPVAAPTPEEAAIAAAQPQPISMEQMEIELCDIVADESVPLDRAATEAINLIERAFPGQRMLDRILAMGEAGLAGFFTQRPILQRVAEHPRLPGFVKAVIEKIKELPVLQQPNPGAPPA